MMRNTGKMEIISKGTGSRYLTRNKKLSQIRERSYRVLSDINLSNYSRFTYVLSVLCTASHKPQVHCCDEATQNLRGKGWEERTWGREVKERDKMRE